MGGACQQGTLTSPDTWFRLPFWDLLVLHLLIPDFSNMQSIYSTFHLEYPLVFLDFAFLLYFNVLVSKSGHATHTMRRC